MNQLSTNRLPSVALSFLVGMCALADAFASQPPGPVFQRLGVIDGLPDNRVEAIDQGRYGYIWIGTQSGLARYDGRRLAVLGPGEEETDLPGRNVMSMLAHSDGTVWAAVGGHGLVRVDAGMKVTGRVALAENDGVLPHDNIWSMAEGCDGSLWLAYMQGGVGRLDPETEDYRHYPQSDASGLAARGFQLQVVRDSRCRIWLVQSEQLSVLNPSAEDARFRAVARRRADDGLGYFLALTETADGELYYARDRYLFHLGNIQFDSLAEPEPGPALLETGRSIISMADDGTGDLLLATYEGLLRWRPGSGVVDHARSIAGLSDTLASDELQAVMVDREGGLWMTMTGNGLAYLPPGHEAFTRFEHLPGRDDSLSAGRVRAVAQQPDGSGLWLGGSFYGIQTLDLESGRAGWLHERYDDDRLREVSPVISLIHDQGRLLIASMTEILLLDLESGEIRELMRREHIDDGTFTFAVPDGSDHLWIGTLDAGLFHLDLDSGALTRYHPDGEGRHHLPETEPTAIVRGPGGNWWAGGRRGLYRLGDQGGFEPVAGTGDSEVVALERDGNGLWLATTAAVERWARREERMRRLTRYPLPDSLPQGQTFRILPDEDGAVWLVRSSGLARLTPDNGRIRNFSRRDGLAVAEFEPQAALKLDDGRLAMGGNRGLALVEPERVRGAAVPPPVWITGVAAGDRHIVLGPGEQRELIFDHDDNTFQIDFAGLSYIAPDQVRYRVRMSGWDEDWIELTGQQQVLYSNLSPGRYRFRVQAATAEGLWNEQGDELALEIRKPPWLSATAMLIYAVAAVLLAVIVWQVLAQIRRRRREMHDALQKRRLAEEQRQLIERLNRSLDPHDLATVISRELLQVAGGRCARAGYLHPDLPGELISVPDDQSPLSRAEWEQRLNRADGESELDITLVAESEPLARVLIELDSPGLAADAAERLRLLEKMAGQALHNALLLQQVRTLAARAEQASHAKSEFLATMSHEIRTPLHGVLGMVELLYETETQPDQQELLHTLRLSGVQLQRIIDDVLDISRIEAGRLRLDPAPFELIGVLEQEVDLHAPNAARKQLDLRLNLASDLPVSAHGDAGRFSQILGNLLSNAVKFTTSGGIEVRAWPESDGMIHTAVIDTGPGIPAGDRQRLFEPFTQLDSSITRRHSGSGLGLPICRQLAGAMGGELVLDEHDGPGSRFVIRLPLAADGAERWRCHDGLLRGLKLAVVATAQTRRALDNLGRRWGFEVIDESVGASGDDCWLLLDPLHADEAALARAAERAQSSAGVIWLHSPFHSRRAASEIERPGGAWSIRWPLNESRLIGLLMDAALRTRHRPG